MSNRLVGRPVSARRAQNAHVPELVKQPADTTGRAVFGHVENTERKRLSTRPSRRGRAEWFREPRNTGRQPKRSTVHRQRVTVVDAQIVGRLVLFCTNAQPARHD